MLDLINHRKAVSFGTAFLFFGGERLGAGRWKLKVNGSHHRKNFDTVQTSSFQPPSPAIKPILFSSEDSFYSSLLSEFPVQKLR